MNQIDSKTYLFVVLLYWNVCVFVCTCTYTCM